MTHVVLGKTWQRDWGLVIALALTLDSQRQSRRLGEEQNWVRVVLYFSCNLRIVDL